MNLPFTHEPFLNVFGQYNTTLWPVALALWLFTLVGAFALARARTRPRLIAGLLAILWVWSGAAYHLGCFLSINAAARVFGILFLVEGVLIAWWGLIRPPPTFVWRRGRGLGS